MTIAPGVIIKFNKWSDYYGDYASDLTINGRLLANGTSTMPIIFTSYNDDGRGGDSNGNGWTAPASQDWGGIWINSDDESTIISNVIISYGGLGSSGANAAVLIGKGQVKIEYTTFLDNDDSVFINGGLIDLGGGILGYVGKNIFSGHLPGTNNWAVGNDTPNIIYAKNNDWGYTNTSQIDGIIYDQKDDSSKGFVIYLPFGDFGNECTADDQCTSGHCADGVCCDDTCLGTCRACQENKTGLPDGTCGNVVAGTDPNGECDDSLSCTQNYCNGSGACSLSLLSGCLISGECIIAGVEDPGNECRACVPYQNKNTYTTKPNGSYCSSDGLSCTTDSCQSGTCDHSVTTGCLIGGVCVADGVSDPSNDCAECNPALTDDAYSAKQNGVSCAGDGLSCTHDACDQGNCGHELAEGCLIGGSCISIGANNPTNECQACQPHIDDDAYSNKADGISCTDEGLTCTNDVCQTGACSHEVSSGCLIDGTCIASGANAPGNECAECNPANDDSAYTNKADGVACSDDGYYCTSNVCESGSCTHPSLGGCLIADTCYSAGDANPENDCEGCHPTLSTIQWTDRIEGYPCSDDGFSYTLDICDGSGSCNHPGTGYCSIDDSNYFGGDSNPGNECQGCSPQVDPDGWVDRIYGYPCTDDGLTDTEDVCDGEGQCIHPAQNACEIDGTIYAGGTINPENECEECNPTQNATDWSPKFNGYPCTDDELACTSDTCQAGTCAHDLDSGCLIGGICVADGAPDPANECAECNPALTTDAYSSKVNGVGCSDDGKTCTEDRCISGQCTHNLSVGCLIDNVIFPRKEGHLTVGAYAASPNCFK